MTKDNTQKVNSFQTDKLYIVHWTVYFSNVTKNTNLYYLTLTSNKHCNMHRWIKTKRIKKRPTFPANLVFCSERKIMVYFSKILRLVNIGKNKVQALAFVCNIKALLQELVHNVINEPFFGEPQVVSVWCQEMKLPSFVQLPQAQCVLKRMLNKVSHRDERGESEHAITQTPCIVLYFFYWIVLYCIVLYW